MQGQPGSAGGTPRRGPTGHPQATHRPEPDSRELCALAVDRPGNNETVEVAKAEARINQALAILGDLDAITRHGNAAAKSLEKIIEVNTSVKSRVEDALRDTLGALGNK